MNREQAIQKVYDIRMKAMVGIKIDVETMPKVHAGIRAACASLVEEYEALGLIKFDVNIECSQGKCHWQDHCAHNGRCRWPKESVDLSDLKPLPGPRPLFVGEMGRLEGRLNDCQGERPAVQLDPEARLVMGALSLSAGPIRGTDRHFGGWTVGSCGADQIAKALARAGYQIVKVQP